MKYNDMSTITNNYAEGSCVFEAGSSQNGDIHITGSTFVQGVAQPTDTTVSTPDAPPESPVHLNTARGTKIDYIRVINTLYELGFFTDDKGGRISKKEVMATLGQAVGIDLTTYDNDLSRSLSDSTKLEKHLAIFERMKAKMEEVFDSYGG